MLGELVEKHGFDNNHPSVQKAAEFLFGFQTEEGDFRGIYGNQYTPNYTAGIMEILKKAGYGNDPRIDKGFHWLLSMRQHDGGWAIPIRTKNLKLDITMMDAETVQPNTSKPFSHMVTGVVLRAFAAHKTYRGTEEAKAAGNLLASRFFKRDNTLIEAPLNSGQNPPILSGSQTSYHHLIPCHCWGSCWMIRRSRPQSNGFLLDNRRTVYGTCPC